MAGWLVGRARAVTAAIRLWCSRRFGDQPAVIAGTTHVIIDMQERFLQKIQIRDRYRTIGVVIEIIEEAKRRGEPIVLLQYRSADKWIGPTDPELLAHLDGYPHFVTYDKWEDNGGPEVEQACGEHNLGTEVFRLYGLNANACVLRTALGLRRRFPRSRVEVVKDACSSYDKRHMWAEYYLWPGAWRIRLVRNRVRQP
jgi:nicotinamidase-related amidase